MCDSYRFRAGRTYELPAPRTTPLRFPGYAARPPPARLRFTIRENPPPLQKSGAPLLVQFIPELVPAIPDMFVTPSWLATATSADQSLSSRAACDPATSRHRRQAPARAHARFFFSRARDRGYSSACHSARRSSYCHPPRAPGRKSRFNPGTGRR